MKPDRLPHPQSLLPILHRLGARNIEPELFVLKCHLIVERELYSLLAIRLDMEEKQLPSLQFFPLAKLALGGDTFKHTFSEVSTLNDLRNEYGHELESANVQSKIELLVKRTGTSWPKHDPKTRPLSWLKLHETSLRVACARVMSDVWIHITELSLEKGLYPSEKAATDARSELREALETRALNREGQQTLQKLYDFFFRGNSGAV